MILFRSGIGLELSYPSVPLGKPVADVLRREPYRVWRGWYERDY